MAEFTEVIKQRKRMCKEQKGLCSKCGMNSRNNTKNLTCMELMEQCPQKAEEIIMNWAKEHPIKTNADKFREVFGINADVDLDACTFAGAMCKKVGYDCKNCEHFDFWHKEYVEPNKGETE